MLFRNNYINWLIDIVSLVLFSLFFYTLFLGSYPLFTPDEGRYAEIALNMINTGDYITPRMNGAIFLDKPILYFWFQVLAIKLLGITEWGVRLFPVLLGILGILMTYISGRQLFERRSALIAAFVLATTPLYFGGTHYANLDLEVAVWISCSLLALLSGIINQNRPFFFFLAYLFAAFAFLTKGLIGFVFPSMIIGTWVIFTRRWEILKKIYLIPGLIMMLCIIAPWYSLAQKANPTFLYHFFVGQQITRYLSGAVFNNQMPPWFFLPVIFIGFFPWSLFLVTVFQSLATYYKNPIKLFLLLWAIIIFIFFSIPHSKLVGYILPIFPPLALIIGNNLSENWDKIKYYVFNMLAINMIFLLSLTASANYLNKRSIKPLIIQLKQMMQPQDEVIAYFKYFQDAPFYLGKHIGVVANWDSPDIVKDDNWLREFWISKSFEKQNNLLVNEKSFWEKWKTKPLFVLVRINYLDQFRSHTKNYSIIGKYNDVLLLSNKNISNFKIRSKMGC